MFIFKKNILSHDERLNQKQNKRNPVNEEQTTGISFNFALN